MADLIYVNNISLDGYIEDENGDFNWSEPSDEAHRFFNQFQQSVGTLLCGRKLYETMRVWDSMDLEEVPEVYREFAEAWRDTDKVVYSSTLDDVPEPRTRLERVFEPETVRRLKDDADRDLSIGGARLAGEAIRAGLVDRYVFRVIPTIVGGGVPALPKGVKVDLTLQETREFDDGTVVVEYSLR